MPAGKPLVVLTRKLPDVVETRMTELFEVRFRLDDRPMSRDELVQAVREADVLAPTVTDRIDAEVLAEAGPRLKLIANYGAGVDNIDLREAHRRGLTVTNTPDVLTEDTADMTMALILAVMRRISEGERIVRSGKWPGWAPMWMLGRRLSGKRLGIIGLGRIGQALARRARGFGLSVHYHNRTRLHPEVEADLDATFWESLDQMLARMDIISVNCPHTPATYHLLSARRLALMPAQAVLVNTARGEIVDENALVRMLEDGRLAGAGLDVFERAPLVALGLLALDNVVLLPHMGSATIEARVEMGEKLIVNIKTFVDGHRPPDRVLHDFIF
jgi:glyoxylate reductase